MTKKHIYLATGIPILLLVVVAMTLWRPALILHGDIVRPLTQAWEREWNKQLKLFGIAQAQERDVPTEAKRYRGGRSWKLLSKIARNSPTGESPVLTAPSVDAFTDDFTTAQRVTEKPVMDMSTSAEWWVTSGGVLDIRDGKAATTQRNLPWLDYWRLQYALSNPEDTQHGRRPQNIFRLVERRTWGDLEQEVSFRIRGLHRSTSTNRNASNGILLLNRYRDGNNLYYTGLRVDGAAVIKKKSQNVYYTLDYRPVFSGTYTRDQSPNLLPENTWMGLRSRVTNELNGTVRIQVWLDRNLSGQWELVAEAVDDGVSYGGRAFTAPGHAGIRTDFMDVEFDHYAIHHIKSDTTNQ